MDNKELREVFNDTSIRTASHLSLAASSLAIIMAAITADCTDVTVVDQTSGSTAGTGGTLNSSSSGMGGLGGMGGSAEVMDGGSPDAYNDATINQCLAQVGPIPCYPSPLDAPPCVGCSVYGDTPFTTDKQEMFDRCKECTTQCYIPAIEGCEIGGWIGPNCANYTGIFPCNIPDAQLEELINNSNWEKGGAAVYFRPKVQQ